jgi:hypothetical protein
MKQYRITSQHFVAQGETGEQDAVMDSADLQELKRLAGVPITEAGGGIGGMAPTPHATEDGVQSPVGSNITFTAAHRNQLLDKYGARPGDELWFMINFEPVRGLGASLGSLEEKIQKYLKQHPDKRPENRLKPPGD